MSAKTSTVPDESNLLLPAVIDLRAQEDPDKLFCVLLKSADVQDGLDYVSYSDYANAVNRCSWWLEGKLGKGDGRNMKTIGYFGPPDIRQTIVALAVSKINHKALLLSPRNSVEGIVELLDVCDCHSLLFAQDIQAITPLVNNISSRRNLQVLPFEAVTHWLDSAKVPRYTFDATLEKDASRPFAILHTSGSTGFPEPAIYTFGAMASYRTFLEPQEVIAGAKRTMVDLWKNKVTYVAFPTSHMVGFLCGTAFNVYWGMTPIFGPGTVIPTPKLAASIHQLDICKSTVLPVSVLEPLTRVPEYLEGLRSLDLTIWCGSPFSSSAVPEKIRSLVTINAGYGATEAGPFVTQVESQDDYEYMSFSPLMGARFQQYTDDLYEMIIDKKVELNGAQHIFCAFPELNEWHSKDLFSKHPTKPDLWRYEGRTDDILVLSTGANINPLSMEGVLMTHPKVVSALLTGERKPETAWLIEVCDPPENVEDRQSLIEELWSTIEKANDEAHVRIEAKVKRSNIIFVTKEKPMSRAAKGSVQRKATIRAYREELDALYDN
ncbi:similar to AMP-binding enzyme [Botrytis cinerea T4]|uniref:Similar to AMP-binding enzyme n=1 Tax=Botryotinia fuckeliana (strain T4) TaxID=999810 RepID=G2YVY0_BOTF4|nr:similar to AMP-binding enzyme [Botrytis cinerea T4]